MGMHRRGGDEEPRPHPQVERLLALAGLELSAITHVVPPQESNLLVKVLWGLWLEDKADEGLYKGLLEAIEGKGDEELIARMVMLRMGCFEGYEVIERGMEYLGWLGEEEV